MLVSNGELVERAKITINLLNHVFNCLIMTERIVFLDRDGTMIESGTINSIQKIRILPNTIPALKLLTDNKFKLFIITNQGDINKGTLTIEQFYKFNNHILRQLEKGG